MKSEVRLRVGHQHSQLLPILVRFVDYYSPFSGPRAISMIDNPRDAFRRLSSTLTVLPILTHFVDYYLPFWGPKAICIVVEPQGLLMCRSSTLIILANSGPFHGLLLMILARYGAPERFSRLTIPRVCLHVLRKYS